jgi:SpoVK/Ycf46/Vps4 family AAA+-type ATPase
LRGSELLSSGSSESDAAIELRKHFHSAADYNDRSHKNISVIFMDECDALLSSDIVGATLALLLDKMTALSSVEEGDFQGISDNHEHNHVGAWKRVLVIAATNRIDAIPMGLRRPGRFDREICISPPNNSQRYYILKSLISKYQNEMNEKHSHNSSLNRYLPKPLNQIELKNIADSSVGYVAADLAALVRSATIIKDDLTAATLRLAMKDVGASALRISTINCPPSTCWSDIAGDAGGAKTALRQAIEWPRLKEKDFARLGLKPPRGILLHGPPGCAKTTLARAAAGAAGVAFLSLSPADVYSSSYVGEAESVVRRAFALARSASPCILFFDEIDSIVGSPTSSSNEGSFGMDRGTSAEGAYLSVLFLFPSEFSFLSFPSPNLYPKYE